MNNVKKHLLNLFLGELAALCSLTIFFTLYNFGKVSLISLILFDFILLQGSIYWLLRYILLKTNKKISKGSIRIASLFRLINLIIIILLFPIMLFIESNRIDMLVGLGFYIFSIVEYVNYYWFRLSYGKSGFNLVKLFRNKLRKSSINKLINQ